MNSYNRKQALDKLISVENLHEVETECQICGKGVGYEEESYGHMTWFFDGKYLRKSRVCLECINHGKSENLGFDEHIFSPDMVHQKMKRILFDLVRQGDLDSNTHSKIVKQMVKVFRCDLSPVKVDVGDVDED